MSSLYQIEKLDETNYDCWSVQMKNVLIHSELWNVVNGSYKKTQNDTKWDAVNDKALATIVLSVKPSQLNNVKNLGTAFEAWKRLEEIYKPSGPARKVTLYKKLLSLNMIAGVSISEYLNSFTDIVEKLAEVNIEIKDELLVLILLSSLPKSYENFVIAMETRDDLPSLKVLRVKLLEEGERRREEHETPNGDKGQLAYFAHDDRRSINKNGNKQQKNKNKFSGNCFKCGLYGHIAAKCTAKKLDKKKPEKSYAFTMLAAATVEMINAQTYVLDSGATAHMCCDRRMFTKLKQHKECIRLAGENFIVAEGLGEIKMKINNTEFVLNDVLYVPKMKGNFLSVDKITEKGFSVKFCKSSANIQWKDDIILKFEKKHKLYLIELAMKNQCYSAVLWHNRYGHLNYKSLCEAKKMVSGIDKEKFTNQEKCLTCMKAKVCSKPYPQVSESRAKNLLDLIHTDLCGPFEKQSISGSKYFITFTDDKSRRVFVYFLATKDQAFDKFILFKNMAERQTGRKIRKIRSDNGGEFINKNFNKFLEENGIERQLTVPYSPSQNGVAERLNRTLIEMARSMLIHSSMSEFLWAEAIATAVYIRNRSPTSALVGVTPYEVWCGKVPSVKHFRTFGCRAVALDKTHHSKFKAKGKEYRMVGYSLTSKAYRLYDPKTHGIIERRDVLFNEADQKECNDNLSFDLINHNVLDVNEILSDEHVKHDSSTKERSDEYQSEDYESADDMEDFEYFSNGESNVVVGPGRPKIERSGKRGRPRKVYNVLNAMIENSGAVVPQTVPEAMNSNESEQWLEAMNEEYKSLMDNKTWSLAKLPVGQKAVGCKWVFAIKRGSDGEIKRYKARLVAKGCSQEYGVNYSETFSPVCRFATIRMILAIAVEKKMYLHQLDVCTAYLNSDLTDDVYMKQPEGYVDKSSPNSVLKLNKAIYGLKQSGRAWNSKIDSVLKNIGFSRSNYEPCLYFMHKEGKLCIVIIYVDDIIIGCESKEDLLHIKAIFTSEFKCVDSGQLKLFLGMRINRDGECGAMTIDHTQYIKQLLEHYGMTDCRTAATPLDPGVKLNCSDKNCPRIDPKLYQSMIGSLMYLALTTRPDILHSVTRLAQHNVEPHNEHYAGVKHVLRYLASTIEMKLKYVSTGVALHGYVDADWGGDTSDRKSHTGFVFYLAGCAFSWESKKQNSVALSSTEAEYMALSTAAKEGVYLKSLLSEIGYMKKCDTIVINGDNLSAQKLAKNPVYHSRSKHIDIRYHFVRQVVESNKVQLKYVSTDNMVADVLTKCLMKGKHCKFVKMLGFL